MPLARVAWLARATGPHEKHAIARLCIEAAQGGMQLEKRPL